MKRHFLMLGILMAFSAGAIFLLVHEGTHLALADEARGVCLGVCQTENMPTAALGLAFGVHNDLSRNETIANTVGLIVTLAVEVTAIIILFSKIAEEDQK